MTERQRTVFPSKEASGEWELSSRHLIRICFLWVSLKGKVTQYWIISMYSLRCLLLDPLHLSWPALAILSLLYLICFMRKHSGQCYHLYCWHLYRDLLISICAACHWRNNKGDSGKLPKWYTISQPKTKREDANKASVNLKINEWGISIK